MAETKTETKKRTTKTTKQKAVVKNADIVKHEVASEDDMTMVEFIIPVFESEDGTIYERGKRYWLNRKQLSKYKGDYKIC